MPIIVGEVLVERTTLQCDFCPEKLAHTPGTGAPLLEEFFTVRAWTVHSPANGERDVVACPRCTPMLRLLVREIHSALAQAVGGRA